MMMMPSDVMEGEIFVPVDNSTKYLISNKGRCWNKIKGAYCNTHNNGGGYYNVLLSGEGLNRSLNYVHRLVAIHFVSNPDNKLYVNHIDGNRSNNVAENLEWVTAKENTKHGMEFGKINKVKRGKTNQLTNEQRCEIVIRHRLGCNMTQVGKLLGLSRTTISSVFNNRSNPELIEFITQEIADEPDWKLNLSLTLNNCLTNSKSVL